MAIQMTYFADKAPGKLAENRSALSTPDTSSVAKCSRLTTSGQSTFRGLQSWKRAFAIVHSPTYCMNKKHRLREVKSRLQQRSGRVSDCGLHLTRRPVPVLVYRHTPERTSICHFEL